MVNVRQLLAQKLFGVHSAPSQKQAEIQRVYTGLGAEFDAELLVSHVSRLSRDHPQRLVKKAMKNAIDSLRGINKVSNDLGMVFTIDK